MKTTYSENRKQKIGVTISTSDQIDFETNRKLIDIKKGIL